MNAGPDNYWSGYLDDPPELAAYPTGAVVVDIGCGSGHQLLRLDSVGCRPIGVELIPTIAKEARHLGFPIVVAAAERLPFRSGSCPGVLCKVVLPYTEEDVAVAEIGRVLASGGRAIISAHGLGYFLRYLLQPDEWRHAIYAVRAILNTMVFRLVGRRIPGVLGDTLFQSPRRLRRYCRDAGLRPEATSRSRKFLGLPVFLGYRLLKLSSGD